MTDLETLESIIVDFVEQNEMSVVDTVAILEAIKFKVLYNNEKLREEKDEEDDEH